MIVSFIGCPSSGKTTLAAMLFAEAKRQGVPNVELLTEQARIFIANKRQTCKERNLPFAITDSDQVDIMVDQVLLEEAMHESMPDGLVITDTYPLNSLLYMPHGVMDSPVVAGLVDGANSLPRLVFYCHPVPMAAGQDPNRIHSAEQSLAIDARIPHVMGRYAVADWWDATTLDHADLEARYLVLCRRVEERFVLRSR